MRLTMKTALLGGAMAAMTTPAFAGSGYGGCGPTATDCGSNVWVSSSEVVRDDVLVSIDQPYGHHKSVRFRSTPTVSITRIHDQGTVPGLDDFPSGFAGDCQPESTQYCRAGTAIGAVPQPLPVPLPAPVVSAPYVAPVAAPAPVHHGLRQWTASYNADPARFQPRQYGSLDFVPGIANVPTSWVDRDPARAKAALNASGVGGIAPGPQTGLSRIADDTPGPQIPVTQFMGPHPVQPGSIVQPGPASHAPEVAVNVLRVQPGAPAPTPLMPTYPHGVPANYGAGNRMGLHPAPVHAPVGAPVGGPVMAPVPFAGAAFGAHSGFGGGVGVSPRTGIALPDLAASYPARPSAPLTAGDGVYASQVAHDGTYWEKAGGTQMMGDTVVTQVICKRALETEVVNPVVGVPQPYPVPVPVECASDVQHMRYAHPAQNVHGTHGLAGGH